MTENLIVWPHERLGRWNGAGWDPVAPLSVDANRVHVFCHGWAPGLRQRVEAHDGFLYVWDDAAETSDGARYNGWFAPLAEALSSLNPGAAILAFSWIDESATSARSTAAVQSQLRTTVNGQRLAVALERVMQNDEARIHLVGHSHGAKVVSVAATLLDRPPAHVTILDSPENMLPIIGGALNNLGSYLRMLPIGAGDNATLVDNYPSRYGIRYGEKTGLGGVIDCVLDPEAFPIEGQSNPHSYAWGWYVHTAQHPELGLGAAWSPLLEHPAKPKYTQLQQRASADLTDANPWELEYAPYVHTGGFARALETRVEGSAEEPRVLTTAGKRSRHGLFYRRQGDQIAMVPMRWVQGSDTATVRLIVNRTERWRAVRGWSDGDEIRARVPLGGLRAGPALYEVRLDAEEPASLEIGDATIRHINLPSGTEYRAWLRPMLFGAATLVLLGALRSIWKLLRSRH